MGKDKKMLKKIRDVTKKKEKIFFSWHGILIGNATSYYFYSKNVSTSNSCCFYC